MSTELMELEILGPFYACANCYETLTWAPEDLRWWNGRWTDEEGELFESYAGWYCRDCMADITLFGEIPGKDLGPSLSDYLGGLSPSELRGSSTTVGGVD